VQERLMGLVTPRPKALLARSGDIGAPFKILYRR